MHVCCCCRCAALLLLFFFFFFFFFAVSVAREVPPASFFLSHPDTTIFFLSSFYIRCGTPLSFSLLLSLPFSSPSISSLRWPSFFTSFLPLDTPLCRFRLRLLFVVSSSVDAANNNGTGLFFFFSQVAPVLL